MISWRLEAVPSLMSFDEDTKRIRKLESDVDMYRKQVGILRLLYSIIGFFVEMFNLKQRDIHGIG